MKSVYSILFYFTTFLLQIWNAESIWCEEQEHLSGVISYESPYREINSFSQCWAIYPPDDSLVRLSLKDLNLRDPYCDSAYIEVVSDRARNEKICEEYYYGTRPPPTWSRAIAGAVNITLKLRRTWNNVNFKMDYHIESVICNQNKHFRCSPHQCIHSNQVCDGVEDCENGLDESYCGIVAVEGANASRISGIKWLKSQQTNFGWKRNTHRALTALYLTGAAQFRGKKLEEEVMVKELELKAAASLLRHSPHSLSANELSMYVNALSVTCHNHRNFFGYDLLKMLANRTFTTSLVPGAYLTLCNANWPLSKYNVQQLLDVLTVDTDYPFVFEIQAMTIMALSCIKQKTDLFHSFYNASKIYNETLENFMVNQNQKDGSFGNAYTTAMVTQALIASGEEKNKLWSADNAIKYLIRSLNSSSVDFLSVYLSLPLFKGKTLVDVGNVDCSNYQRKLEEDDDILDVSDKLTGKIYVQYSLYIGDLKDVIHTMYLRVPENSTALDVMRIAQVADPKYKFSYHKTRQNMYIYEIAGITNDMEAGKFWFFYTTPSLHHESSNKSPLTPITKNVDEIFVKNKEHLVLWYKTAAI